MPAKIDKPNCQEGQSCGMGCISRKDTCSGSVAKEVASRLVDVATKQPKRVNLPANVEFSSKVVSLRAVTFTESVYKFSTRSGDSVRLSVLDSSTEAYGSVGFTVNGSDEKSYSGESDKREAVKIAVTLASIIKYDASTRADGYSYNAEATIEDGDGYKRAAAYERLGFSRPVDGVAGNSQFGLVTSGKITPDISKLESLDTKSYEEIENRLLDNKRLRQAAKLG